MSRSKPNMARRICSVASLLCILACAAFMILWVRSYYQADRLHGRFWGRQSFVVAAKQGRLTFVAHRWDGRQDQWHWQLLSVPANAARSFPIGIRAHESALGFGVVNRPLMKSPPFEAQELLGPVDVEFVEGMDVIVLTGNPRALAHVNGAGVIVPFWLLVLLAAALSAGLHMRRPWQYGMRGLLAVITFVSVLLGLIAILDREPVPAADISPAVEEVMRLIEQRDVSPVR